MTITDNLYLKSALKAGLSAKAASVYVALLEAGAPLSPKGIILQTRLHRQYVYDALRELQDKQLVTAVGEKRRVKYGAVSPDRLVQEAEKQRIDVLDGVQNLMKLYDRSPAGVVEVIRGREAAIENDFQLIREAKEGDFIDVIGGAGMHWVHLLEDRMEEWEAIRRQKRVKIRYIGTGEDVRFNLEESITENESRVIPGIGDIVNVVIRPESVIFNIYEPEIVNVVVKNPAAVASQRALFEVLWSVAK
jgi:sugar-specific transcriptional regulator TrmB